MALSGAFQGPAETEDRLSKETEILPARVKLKLPRRRGQGMTIKNDDLFARLRREFFQACAQFQFFRSK